MAGDWIPMRLDLCDDPAVLEMADITNQPEEYIVGCLHRIWSWASRNCHDGTVTGVTKMSLSRAVRLPEVVSAMVKVGWLIEGSTDDGRPFVQFPKWENWLSRSAKSRINNAISQRKSRANKSAAVDQDPKTGHGAVTNLSPSSSDETVTTVENRTEEDLDKYINACKQSEFLAEGVICPEWLKTDFCRWLAYREAIDGRKVPFQLQEQWIYDLNARGPDKALADIAFSISKQAKNICKAENDFGELFKKRMESSSISNGQSMAGAKGNRLRAAEELRKAIEEDQQDGR